MFSRCNSLKHELLEGQSEKTGGTVFWVSSYVCELKRRQSELTILLYTFCWVQIRWSRRTKVILKMINITESHVLTVP